MAGKNRRFIGWQGFALHTPEDWDLTGFSGTDAAGYFRVDDSEEQGVEVKWGTESPKVKAEPDPEARLDGYFKSLRQAAKRKKLALETKYLEAPRGVLRPERKAVGFTWVGDRKGIGAVWYCRTCRRVVIVQVLGAPSGRGGLAGVSEGILGSLECHGADPAWRRWALYDLDTEVPSEYALVGQQLMNVYLRLSFAHKAARLSVEQWSLANVARRDAYLDVWLGANTKAEMNEARYVADETEAQGHPALALRGGPKVGRPMIDIGRQLTRFQKPATRFSATAWECGPSNKLYLVEGFRPAGAPDAAAAVAARTRCHKNENE